MSLGYARARRRHASYKRCPNCGTFQRTLTERQLTVMRLLARGYRETEVAAALKVSKQTVKQITWRLCGLTGAANYIQLASWWRYPLFQLGLRARGLIVEERVI